VPIGDGLLSVFDYLAYVDTHNDPILLEHANKIVGRHKELLNESVSIFLKEIKENGFNGAPYVGIANLDECSDNIAIEAPELTVSAAYAILVAVGITDYNDR
jgi:hypothetical protein